jgi:hypothetical protein
MSFSPQQSATTTKFQGRLGQRQSITDALLARRPSWTHTSRICCYGHTYSLRSYSEFIEEALDTKNLARTAINRPPWKPHCTLQDTRPLNPSPCRSATSPLGLGFGSAVLEPKGLLYGHVWLQRHASRRGRCVVNSAWRHAVSRVGC